MRIVQFQAVNDISWRNDTSSVVRSELQEIASISLGGVVAAQPLPPDNQTPDNQTPDNQTPDNQTPDNQTCVRRDFAALCRHAVRLKRRRTK